MMIDLELVFSAVGLPDEAVERWISLNKRVLTLVHAAVVTDTEKSFPGLRTVNVASEERFDIGRLNNRAIRTSECNVVVKTDVDIVFSLELIQYLWTFVSPGTGVVAKCSNIDLDRLGTVEWCNTQIRSAGRGACFALFRSDWERLYGYDERFIGWGGDDDDMYRRASRALKMIQTAQYPLWHINHPKRIDDRFPNCGKMNLETPKNEGDWHDHPLAYCWGSGSWGDKKEQSDDDKRRQLRGCAGHE